MKLSEFISLIPEFALLSKTPSKLVPYFALFIEMDDPNAFVAAGAIDRLFDDARVRKPSNTSDVIRKSKCFVRTAGGYRLSHESRERCMEKIPIGNGPSPTVQKKEVEPAHMAQSTISSKDIFVVYGRDERLRSDFFSFLRTLGLNPLQFDQMAHLTGSASPTTWQVIKTGFAHAQACVVLFSPDEHVKLREDLQGDDDSDEDGMQSRPNVLVEAGMALALHPDRTVLVKVGKVREISDLAGMQYVKLTNEAARRNRLISKLETAGCPITRHGDDWLNTGDFAADRFGR